MQNRYIYFEIEASFPLQHRMDKRIICVSKIVRNVIILKLKTTIIKNNWHESLLFQILSQINFYKKKKKVKITERTLESNWPKAQFIQKAVAQRVESRSLSRHIRVNSHPLRFNCSRLTNLHGGAFKEQFVREMKF